MKEKSFTKNNKQTRDLNVGWYSEDDMVKVLKWNKFLGLKQFAVEHISLNFTIFWDLPTCVSLNYICSS